MEVSSQNCPGDQRGRRYWLLLLVGLEKRSGFSIINKKQKQDCQTPLEMQPFVDVHLFIHEVMYVETRSPRAGVLRTLRELWVWGVGGICSLETLSFYFQTSLFAEFCQKHSVAFHLSRNYTFYQQNHSLKLPIQKEENPWEASDMTLCSLAIESKTLFGQRGPARVLQWNKAWSTRDF